MCKVFILDARHLSDLESKDGGFHICPENHPRDAFVRQRRTSLLTGVWCGKVFDETNPAKIRKEFTSFVPRKMSLQHYQSLIALAIDNDSCKIAQQNNRRLYRVDDTDNSFVIECYFQEEGTRIRSAIPVFHYEVYNGTDTSFTVRYSYKHSLEEGNPVFLYNFEVVYSQLFELLQTYQDPLPYEMDDKIIVDIGKLYNSNPKYGRCPIEQGILVEIPKKSL